jgi:hypothetical protein
VDFVYDSSAVEAFVLLTERGSVVMQAVTVKVE